ncbi:hypothetical protein ABT024_09870 [Streptomyces sp. NPDC002812]|uniref:hypothetical protein n=1 Tax=Streptomyces sp. NPDC002812 TaxID=3154434 RepID=UPI003332B142
MSTASPDARSGPTLPLAELLGAVAMGAAGGALRAWTELARTRTTTDGGSVPPGGDYEQVLARSTAEIEAAGVLLERTARLAGRVSPGDLPICAWNMPEIALTIDRLTEAVEQLHRGSVNTGVDVTFAEGQASALQGLWQEVHAITSHPAVRLPAPPFAGERTVSAQACRAEGDREMA